MAAGRAPLEIVNETLLSGMKTVGELFGAGEMQLPFVLQSAEVMKTAVAHLEPHMDKVEGQNGKGTIVLATVKGDVHDIGKNLVDIILSNNGYSVVNIGIKQPVSAILDAAVEHDADVVGMSGLLVKSTVVMKENLLEMNSRGVAQRFPVILGGRGPDPRLRRAGPRRGLRRLGPLRPGRLRGPAPHGPGDGRPARRGRPGAGRGRAAGARPSGPPGTPGPGRSPRPGRASRREPIPSRSDVADDNLVPTPPFWGSRVTRGIALADYASWLDERALFLGQWGLRGSRGGSGPTYEELVETEGRPRLRELLARVQAEGIVQAAVVHGYFPAVSKGDDLIVLDPDLRR